MNAGARGEAGAGAGESESGPESEHPRLLSNGELGLCVLQTRMKPLPARPRRQGFQVPRPGNGWTIRFRSEAAAVGREVMQAGRAEQLLHSCTPGATDS
jgi:hypothetical protein